MSPPVLHRDLVEDVLVLVGAVAVRRKARLADRRGESFNFHAVENAPVAPVVALDVDAKEVDVGVAPAYALKVWQPACTGRLRRHHLELDDVFGLAAAALLLCPVVNGGPFDRVAGKRIAGALVVLRPLRVAAGLEILGTAPHHHEIARQEVAHDAVLEQLDLAPQNPVLLG